MRTPPLLWALRVLWLLLPVGVGDLLDGALDGRPTAVVATLAVASWAVWAAGLGALALPLPATLTLLRCIAPLPLVAGSMAAIVAPPAPLGWAGLGLAALVLVVAFAAEVGGAFVDGASYGDERRFPLRPPALVGLAAAPVVWVLTVLPPLGAAWALAARAWAVGGVLAVLAAAGVPVGARILHRLSRRWLVMVPAGVTVVDDLALAEPVLLPARATTRVGPAHVGTTALDLTAGAAGLVLQVDTSPPVPLVPAVGRGRVGTEVAAPAVLVCPSRPGAVLAEAARRGLPVAHD